MVKFEDFEGSQESSHHLRALLNYFALLLPAIILFHIGYLKASEPISIYNYQIIILLWISIIFILLLIIANIAKIRYKIEKDEKIKLAKRLVYAKYQKIFLEIGWVFREYLSRILFGVFVPFIVVVINLYFDPKNFKRNNPTTKAWILGLIFYPVLFMIAYFAIETGLAYNLLLFGPLCLFGLLKTWGDYSYNVVMYNNDKILSVSSSISQIKKIGSLTFIRSIYDDSLNLGFIRNIFVLSRDVKNSINFTAVTYYEPKSGKKPASQVKRLYFDGYSIYQSEDLDLSFVLIKEKAKPIFFNILHKEEIGIWISRWAAVSNLLFSVDIPKYEFMLLRINDRILPLSREFTHYIPSLFARGLSKQTSSLGL